MSKRFPRWQQQIKSPEWQKKRLEILNLRGFKCEKCGNKEKTLHVHHRFYISGRLIHEYDNDVLQVLCEDCHKKEHSCNNKYDDLIKQIERHDKVYDENALEDIVFILECINNGESYANFISDLSNAFNGCFCEKIAIDLRTNSLLDRLAIDVHLLNQEKYRRDG